MITLNSTSLSPKQVDSPFNPEEEKLPDPILASYGRLCPGGFVRDNNELTDDAANPDVNSASKKISNPVGNPSKRRKKRGERFTNPGKGLRTSKHKYTPVSLGSRKKKHWQYRKPVYDKSEWTDFDATKYPERKMRECISHFYLLVFLTARMANIKLMVNTARRRSYPR